MIARAFENGQSTRSVLASWGWGIYAYINLLSAAWVLADKIILQTKRSSLIPLVDGVKNCFYLRIILLVVCACIDHTLR